MLAETRRKHASYPDYGHNLAQMQEWLGQIKRQLLIRQQQLNQQAEPILRVLDALPDLLATLQTMAARCPQMNVRELQQTEQSVLQKIYQLNELLLPLAVTQQGNNELQQGLFALVTLINEHKMAIQGEQ
ncbi:hypothetical protein [Arsukibacterium perlucidum]|uniref:hypothetical protein n=1 Tax=Arsukibacterium perlucidum TaxID=368811 RepID=UPI00037AEDB3|nr:hypothetical protein [Arsukibacterium perlucidum]